jgi:serine/threonine protein kinase
MQTIGSSDPSDPFIGRVLPGGLQLVERLGVTGEGTLYRGQYSPTGLPVAVTLLRLPARPPGPSGTSSLSDRHLQQLRRACRIQHPNVAGLLDVGETPDGIAYTVGELLTGQVVSDILAVSGGMPAAQAVEICLQVAEGLRAAHAAGVVHGSISPDAVLVTGGGERLAVKLIRFDFARYESDEAASGRSTQERWATDPPDPTDDIVGLGVLLHYLLAGTPPASEGGRHAMPAALRGVIDRALGARGRPYPTVAALADDLARHTGAAARRPRAARARLWLAALAASAALLVAGLWFAWSRERGEAVEARNEVGTGTSEVIADSQASPTGDPGRSSVPAVAAPRADSNRAGDSESGLSPFRRSHPWAAQPDGREYFSSSCSQALRATDLLYFRSEAEARATGRTRSRDPHCS